jgi:hypothetical protein
MLRPDARHTRTAVFQRRAQERGSEPIGDGGGMHPYIHYEAVGLREQMTRAFVDLCAPSDPRAPPCSVIVTAWLSRMAALGVGSRPCVGRTASRHVVCILSHVPVSRPWWMWVHPVGQRGTSGGNARQTHPPRTRDTMACTILRLCAVRERPSGVARGRSGSRMLPSASVRSRGEGLRFMTAFGWNGRLFIRWRGI